LIFDLGVEAAVLRGGEGGKFETVDGEVCGLWFAALAVVFFGAGDNADDVGQFAGVAGVEDAAEDVVLFEDFFGLVGDQGGSGALDGAKEGGGADVGGAFGAVDDAGQEMQQGAFAATVPWGFDGEVGGDIAQFPGVGVEGEQGDDFRNPFGQDDKAIGGPHNGVQNEGGGGVES